MHKYYDAKFRCNVVSIHPGEYAVSKGEDVFTTTLGSCVSVCFYEPSAKVAGINHYMLPNTKSNLENPLSAKYGTYSIEIVINEMIKLGANRFQITAKLFGGANMFKVRDTDSSIGKQNINFAYEYLKNEKISVVNQDVGLDHARKIYLFSDDGKVKLFRINNEEKKILREEENIFMKKMEILTENKSKITLPAEGEKKKKLRLF